MKKQIYLLVLSSIFLLLPNLTYADCTEEEIEHFKDIEDEYKITYEYNKESADYSINIYNADPEKYIFVPTENSYQDKCTDFRKQNVSCKNMASADYEFMIISTNNECDYGFKLVSLKLAVVNKYWNDPMCKGIEEFVLCSPIYDKEISYEEFKSRVSTYKNSKEKKESQEKQISSIEENKIIKYVKSNYQIALILIALIITIVLIIILVAKKVKKSRRLE